jgi:glycosyltransferase involved in cell wall biosynthesis
MSLLEALSVATPAVVSPAVGRLVDVETAGAGWVADQNTLGPLLRRLQEAGRSERASRGRAAVELAKRYDWSVVAQQYEGVYEQAIRSRRVMKP